MLLAANELAQMVRNGSGVGWDRDTHWGMVIVMIVVAVLLIGVIVWAVIYTTRRSPHTGAPPQAPPSSGAGSTSARELLDLRYARGEIDTAEYEERRDKLG